MSWCSLNYGCMRDVESAQLPFPASPFWIVFNYLLSLQSYMYQILKAIRYAHLNCIMHRDLKPQNVLVDMRSGRVKVADFGLARSFLPPCKAYTDKVVTLWYRAPELLLGARTYSALIDMWSMGCIMAELLNSEPLFRAESEIGLLHKVFQALGTPSEDCWTGVAQLQHFRASFPQWKAHPWSQVGGNELICPVACLFHANLHIQICMSKGCGVSQIRFDPPLNP
jgi:serine/threonine protein kinase